MTRKAALLLCALVALAAPHGGADDTPPAVLDAGLGGERLHVPLAELAERAPLAPGQDFRVVEVGRDAHTSHHVVSIRTRETPHRHDRHELWVAVLRGHGTLRLGDATRPVGPGSLLYVPRGTVHAFANAADAPAVAYAVYAPAFDGADRVGVGLEVGPEAGPDAEPAEPRADE